LTATNRFYICGWYTEGGEEQFVFGSLFADLQLEYLSHYGSPGIEKGGDCAITPDNSYFIGAFSTKHTHPFVG